MFSYIVAFSVLGSPDQLKPFLIQKGFVNTPLVPAFNDSNKEALPQPLIENTFLVQANSPKQVEEWFIQAAREAGIEPLHCQMNCWRVQGQPWILNYKLLVKQNSPPLFSAGR